MTSNKTQTQGQQARRVSNPIDPYQGAIAALEYFGVAHDGRRFGCPLCGTELSKKKTVIRTDGGITCHKCGSSLSTGNMWGTVQRLAELFGQGPLEKGAMLSILRGVDPTGERGKFVVEMPPTPDPEPETFVDTEVLTKLISYADEEAGIAYWRRVHIDPKVAKAFGAVRITSPWRKVWQALDDEFGEERLTRAGLCKRVEDGDLWTVPGGKITPRGGQFAPDYPVLQVYRNADGDPVGLEVRGGEYVEGLVRRHDEYKREMAAWEEAGGIGAEPEKVRWTPKTRNLIGNATGSRPGFGLDVVSKFPPQRVIWLVEGYKDALAAGSLGRPAIGIAGAKAGISDEALEVLSGRRVAVVFDADDAGREGGAMVSETLRRAGIELVPHPRWPDGRDVADQLAAMHLGGDLVCADGCGT